MHVCSFIISHKQICNSSRRNAVIAHHIHSNAQTNTFTVYILNNLFHPVKIYAIFHCIFAFFLHFSPHCIYPPYQQLALSCFLSEHLSLSCNVLHVVLNVYTCVLYVALYNRIINLVLCFMLHSDTLLHLQLHTAEMIKLTRLDRVCCEDIKLYYLYISLHIVNFLILHYSDQIIKMCENVS